MTAKEMAEELVDKFLPYADIYHNGSFENAKKCALITVQELINTHNAMKDFLFSEIGYLITSPEGWEEVKKEIEKLKNEKQIVDQKLIWCTRKPTHHGTYVCDIGAKGVIYGWYDGEKWYKYGTNYSEQDRIYIYGWIDCPRYLETKSSQIKKQ